MPRTGEDGERGGLPCAVDTQQPEAFALVDAQRQAADRILAARVHLQHHTQQARSREEVSKSSAHCRHGSCACCGSWYRPGQRGAGACRQVAPPTFLRSLSTTTSLAVAGSARAPTRSSSRATSASFSSFSSVLSSGDAPKTADQHSVPLFDHSGVLAHIRACAKTGMGPYPRRRP